MIDLAKREELEKAATPGPWSVVGYPWNESEDYVIAGHDDPHIGKFVCDCGGQRDFETEDQRSKPNECNDAHFIAAARNDAAEVNAWIREMVRLAELSALAASAHGEHDLAGELRAHIAKVKLEPAEREETK